MSKINEVVNKEVVKQFYKCTRYIGKTVEKSEELHPPKNAGNFFEMLGAYCLMNVKQLMREDIPDLDVHILARMLTVAEALKEFKEEVRIEDKRKK